ncbi:MAG: hypothetical protein NTU86_03120 [Burkholderiales bacterium]|nr:hypothetical protein [Burkholderiales bacterium]
MKVTVTKIDAAVEQMDWAIKLLLDNQAYIPAITLAGAAEAIIGENLGESSVFSQLKAKFCAEYNLSEKYISQEYLNRTRNWLKHGKGMQDAEQTKIELEEEAVQYIVRSLTNLVLHDCSLPSEGPRFFEWLSKRSK